MMWIWTKLSREVVMTSEVLQVGDNEDTSDLTKVQQSIAKTIVSNSDDFVYLSDIESDEGKESFLHFVETACLLGEQDALANVLFNSSRSIDSKRISLAMSAMAQVATSEAKKSVYDADEKKLSRVLASVADSLAMAIREE
jgi:hypothetical protein